MEAFNAKKEQKRDAVPMQPGTETKLEQPGDPAAASMVSEGGPVNQIQEINPLMYGNLV